MIKVRNSYNLKTDNSTQHDSMGHTFTKCSIFMRRTYNINSSFSVFFFLLFISLIKNKYNRCIYLQHKYMTERVAEQSQDFGRRK